MVVVVKTSSRYKTDSSLAISDRYVRACHSPGLRQGLPLESHSQRPDAESMPPESHAQPACHTRFGATPPVLINGRASHYYTVAVRADARNVPYLSVLLYGSGCCVSHYYTGAAAARRTCGGPEALAQLTAPGGRTPHACQRPMAGQPWGAATCCRAARSPPTGAGSTAGHAPDPRAT